MIAGRLGQTDGRRKNGEGVVIIEPVLGDR